MSQIGCFQNRLCKGASGVGRLCEIRTNVQYSHDSNHRKAMTEFLNLSSAVSQHVNDGDIIAMEGFTHLIPFAAAHEIIRQGFRELTVVRMTPDLIYDQLIGAGCVRKLVFSWGGNPGVGSLRRFRDAVENSWPQPLEIEEHSHAGMANRFVAGAAGMPFSVMKGYSGTSLPQHTSNVAFVECPFTGETVTAVAALNPDVGIIHAQRADQKGNIQIWGISGIQREVLLASKNTIVTVEEVVDELDPRPRDIVIPAMVVNAVCEVPGGAKPSYALGYYERDNDAYVTWDATSSDRSRFLRWLDENVLAG